MTILDKYCIVRLTSEEYYKCRNIWDMSKQKLSLKWYDEFINGNRIVFVYKIKDEFIGEGTLVFENGDRDYTIPNHEYIFPE